MPVVPKTVKVVSFLALLASGPGPFGLRAMPGKGDPGATRTCHLNRRLGG
jgi:hypothetical protein